MSQKYAVVFPGQGSQSVGMMVDLYDNHPVVKDTFSEASDALAFDLWAMIKNGPVESLNQTHNTQPAMLASGIAVWRLMNESEIAQPAKLAGHSLGEYSALVASGAMKFADAVTLVAERGRLMQEAVPEGEGAMAAILGLDDETVIKICSEVANDQIAEAVNFNSPGQVVIAGNKEAVERAIALAKESGAKRALPLPVSAPSHCTLMKPAADKLFTELEKISINCPEIPVVHNVDVSTADSNKYIASLLAQQLHHPVRWVETIQSFAADDISLVVEAGPGKVLAGLCKRIDRSITGMGIFDNASFEKFMETLNA